MECFRKKILCANCGKIGHEFKFCNEPITSYGIININIIDDINESLILKDKFSTKKNTHYKVVSHKYPEIKCYISNNIKLYEDYNSIYKLDNETVPYNNEEQMHKFWYYKNKILFMMVGRRFSLGFIEFIRGKYNVYDTKSVVNLFEQMYDDEIKYIPGKEYDDILYYFLNRKNESKEVVLNRIYKGKYSNEYCEAKIKFNMLVMMGNSMNDVNGVNGGNGVSSTNSGNGGNSENGGNGENSENGKNSENADNSENDENSGNDKNNKNIENNKKNDKNNNEYCCANQSCYANQCYYANQCCHQNNSECCTNNDCRTILCNNCRTILCNNCRTILCNNCRTTLCNNCRTTLCNNCRTTLCNNCRTILCNNCRTVPNNDCRTILCNNCRTVPNNDCSTVPNNDCRTIPNNDCSTVPNNDCSTVPNNDCSTVPNNDCRTVPWNLDFYVKNIKPKWKKPEWGFPKGRRDKHNEENLSCACREFEEETGYKKTDYSVLNRIESIEEKMMGTNGIKYKHIYYLAINNSNKDHISSDYDIYEIGDIKWFTYNEAMLHIRPYHVEKKEY